MSTPTNGFPRALLSLSDDELSAIMTAARPLHPTVRGLYLGE